MMRIPKISTIETNQIYSTFSRIIFIILALTGSRGSKFEILFSFVLFIDELKANECMCFLI